MKMSEIELFQGTNENDCQRMLECFRGDRRFFEAGEVVCDYGAGNSKIGVLEEGTVNIVRIDVLGNQTILDRVDEGGIFGEMVAFSAADDASTFVVCEKDSFITFIDYREFSKRCSRACNCHTVVVENMFRLVADKAYQLSERIEVLTSRSIREKLMCFFHIQCVKCGKNYFALPFSFSDLADHICVDRSAMMREIKKMKDDGLIETNGRMVTIL